MERRRARPLRPVALKQSLTQLLGPLAGELTVSGKKCHMPHLSARANLTFAIVMEKGVGMVQQSSTFGVALDCLNVFTDEIDHSGRAVQTHLLRWQTAHHSNLLFELGEIAGIERVMP